MRTTFFKASSRTFFSWQWEPSPSGDLSHRSLPCQTLGSAATQSRTSPRRQEAGVSGPHWLSERAEASPTLRLQLIFASFGLTGGDGRREGKRVLQRCDASEQFSAKSVMKPFLRPCECLLKSFALQLVFFSSKSGLETGGSKNSAAVASLSSSTLPTMVGLIAAVVVSTVTAS